MLRVRPHGHTEVWWCIQEKRWWGWQVIAKYFNTREAAEKELDAINEKEASE